MERVIHNLSNPRWHTQVVSLLDRELTKLRKAMARLPEDLIVEILVKLPVKSLLRFRCVCKSWFHLIKSPNFIEMHLKHHSTKNGCILVIRGLEDFTTSLMSFHSYESLSSVVSLPHWKIPHFNDISIVVCRPCNGLLCISDGVTIVLCNPAMRELKVLPPFPFQFPEEWELSVEAIGFGFNSNTKDYKVVALVTLYQRYRDNYINKVEIYNLIPDSWREIDHDQDMPSIDHDPGYGMLLNGAFHWTASDEDNHFILSFDMNREVFRLMKLPEIDLKEGKCKRLMALNESLALWVYADPWDLPEQQFVDIWVMQQYGVEESWTKQFIVGPVTGLWRPILLWKNEVVLLESLGRQLVSCALDTHEMNDFDIHCVRESMKVMVYQESLVSIK